MTAPGVSAPAVPLPTSGSTRAKAAASVDPRLLVFGETGLPANVSWSVQYMPLGGGVVSAYSVVGPSLTINISAGVYQFSLANITVANTLYVPSPGSGTVLVGPVDAMVEAVFAAVPLDPLTFSETGLGSYLGWTVALQESGTQNSSQATSYDTTVTFELRPGTYSFAVHDVTSASNVFVPTPASGTVALAAQGVEVNVSFAPETVYPLTLEETGLPAGTDWNVGIVNAAAFTTSGLYVQNSTNRSISFEVAAGSYVIDLEYDVFANVSAPCLYLPPWGLNEVYVPVGGRTVNLTFVADPAETFTFAEQGLPTGTLWSVGVVDQQSGLTEYNLSRDPTVSLILPNGTYYYEVRAYANNSSLAFSALPASGILTTSTAPPGQTVSFTTLYQVQFAQVGVPATALWYVNISGGPRLWNLGMTGSTWAYLPNGTYSYSISTDLRGYVGPFRNSTVTVSGEPVTVPLLEFSLQRFQVTLTESGLPSTLLSRFGWTASLDGRTAHSTGSAVTFGDVPNATVPMLVVGPSGYRATAPGSMNVTGPTSLQVNFSKGRTFTLAFAEQGLSAGQSWCVSLRNLSTCGTAPTLRIRNLSSGSYSGVAATATGWEGPVWIRTGSGPARIIWQVPALAVPKVVRVSVIFAAGVIVTFVPSGLASGSGWYLTVDGTTWDAPWNSAMTFSFAPGRYPYVVGKVTGYRTKNGVVELTGPPVEVVVTFVPRA